MRPVWCAQRTLLALLLLAGCAGRPVPAAAPAAAGPASPADADTAAAPDTPGQVMVTLRPAPPDLWTSTTFQLARAYRLRTVFSWTMASLGEQCIVFEVPRGHSVAETLRRLHSDPRVGTAQPVATFSTLAAAAPAATSDTGYNDPYAHLQHSVQALHLAQAHRWATGKGVRVAVIDTGIDLDHPDLRGRVVKANSFVDRGEQTFTSDVHGTAVAGVIAATSNNQVGIVGVAPQAELYALKACWQKAPGQREAVCDSYTLAKAIDFAIVQGAQVLNFSLGGPYDPLLARLIGVALSHGVAVVAADAGDGARSFPASLPGVIGIFGIDDLKGERRARTVANPDEVGAPSVDILTTVPHGSYDFFSGSSFAAAQVTGVVALVLEREPKMSPARLAALLRKTAHPLPLPPAGDPPPPSNLPARLSAPGPQTPQLQNITEVDACAALASALGSGSCP